MRLGDKWRVALEVERDERVVEILGELAAGRDKIEKLERFKTKVEGWGRLWKMW